MDAWIIFSDRKPVCFLVERFDPVSDATNAQAASDLVVVEDNFFIFSASFSPPLVQFPFTIVKLVSSLSFAPLQFDMKLPGIP